MPWFVAALLLAFCSTLQGQDQNFAGFSVGVSTLSADGVSQTQPGAARISLYKPENGWAGVAVAGRHLSDYWSLEGVYGWNRNQLTLTSSRTESGELAFYEQRRNATTQRAIAELMFYARKRSSRMRPYLSAGGGVVSLTSGADAIRQATEEGFAAPGEISALRPALQVAVGVDVKIGAGWDFRFAFSETISGNPISKELTPRAPRNLANFQNLFGFVKRF